MSRNPNPSSRIEHPCWNRILLSRSLIHLRLEAADAIADSLLAFFRLCDAGCCYVVGLCSWRGGTIGVVFPRKIRHQRK